MFRNLATLVSLNLKELTREKYFQALIVLAILLLILSSLLGLLSFDEKRRILFHLGVFSIQVCTYLSAMMFGAINLSRDVREQTFQIILARPVTRFQFLFSKILSGFVLLFVIPGVLSLLLYGLLEFQLNFVGFFQNFLSIVIEAWILFSFALFVSTFSRPALSFLLTGVFYLAGHWRDDLVYFAKKSQEGRLARTFERCKLRDSSAEFPRFEVDQLRRRRDVERKFFAGREHHCSLDLPVYFCRSFGLEAA